MSSNSVSNHTRDKQIGLPLRGRPVLLSCYQFAFRIRLSPATGLLRCFYVWAKASVDVFFTTTPRHRGSIGTAGACNK